MRKLKRLQSVILVTVFAIAIAAGVRADESGPEQPLLGAGHERHLVLVVPADNGKFRLVHQAEELSPDRLTTRTTLLSRAPEEVAVWNDRLWLVFPPAGDGTENRRQVFTLQIVPGPAPESWMTLPRDRLGIVPPLVHPGTLCGFEGTPSGPVALLRHEGALSLMRLEGRTWSTLPMPQTGGGAEATVDHARLCAPQSEGRGLTVLATTAGGRTTHVHRQESEGAWASYTLDIDLHQIRSTVRAGSQLLATVRDERGLRLEYLGRQRERTLCAIDDPAGPFVILALGGWPRLIVFDAAADDPNEPESLRVSLIDPASGSIDAAIPMVRARLGGGYVLQLALMLAVAVTLTVLVLVFRPSVRGAIKLPPELRVMSAASRAGALLIDLVPGAGLSMLITGAGPDELWRAPMFSMETGSFAPFLIMIVITCGHCAVVEVLTGASLGKRILGAHVVSMTGERPTRRRIFVRNFVKLLVLMVPPLMLLGLLNPYLQGIHDMAAQTLVVGEAAESSDSASGEEHDR